MNSATCFASPSFAFYSTAKPEQSSQACYCFLHANGGNMSLMF